MDRDLWDSTSTNPYYKPGDLGMSEAEGLGYSIGNMFKTGAKMLDPVETVVGIGTAISGAINDGVRAFGGDPGENAPSFVGGIKDAAKQVVNNPAQALFDMATAPGSIPAMALGASAAKIPQGTAYNVVRSRPGTQVVRDRLKGVGVYDYIPEGNPYARNRTFNDVRERRRPDNYYNSEFYKKASDYVSNPGTTILDKVSVDPHKLIKKHFSGTTPESYGFYYHDLDSFIKPRKNHEYKDPSFFHEATSDQHLVDPKWAKQVERHETIHALNNKTKLLGSNTALNPNKRQIPEVVRKHLDEASAFTGHERSVTKGLELMHKYYSNNNYGKSGKLISPVLKGAINTSKVVRKPGLMTGVVPYAASQFGEED